MAVASFVRPLLREGVAGHTIVNARNGRIVADRLTAAFDSSSRRKGLLKQDSMPDGAALIIAPSNAIHTFFMRFAIDVVFVAKDGRVLKTRAAMPAWRMAASLRAFAVIELPAGTLGLADLKRGDQLVISRR
jgi:uncharacterized membrane protein (UPF0127 family)